MNMKTGAWILSLVALAALVTIVLAEGAPAVRWIAFGTATGCGFIAVGLIATLALGWDNPSEAKGSGGALLASAVRHDRHCRGRGRYRLRTHSQSTLAMRKGAEAFTSAPFSVSISCEDFSSTNGFLPNLAVCP